jgi:predicted HicB family RNase H-like nuclease
MTKENVLRHKNYVGRFSYDPEADLFHGEVIGTRDVITFQGRSIDELKQALRDSIEDYLEFCAAEGRAPDRSYSGTISIRLDPELHWQVAQASKVTGQSLNAWIVEALKRAAR